MADGKGKTVDVQLDKTVIKALALGGLLGGGGECAVDVKDDKIVRIRPFRYDWKYDRKDFNAWKITRNGKTFEPLFKSMPSPFSMAHGNSLGYFPGMWGISRSQPALMASAAPV